MTSVQKDRFEFLQSFVILYGFRSLCDFETEISVKELKKKDPFLQEVNQMMCQITRLFPMSLFNLKRKDYLIDSENLAIKVLRKCLECTNIPYEHLHRQHGNVLRLIPPNIMYMNYIIQKMDATEMKDIVHGMEMKEIVAMFDGKDLSIQDFKKRTSVINRQPEPHRLSRQDLGQTDEILTCSLELSNNTSHTYNLFDYLNEFCVLNFITIDYQPDSHGGLLKLTIDDNDLVVLDDVYQKNHAGSIEVTSGVCSYDYPLPLAYFYHSGSIHLKINCPVSIKNCYQRIEINYSQLTQINLEQYKRLFCTPLTLPVEQRESNIYDVQKKNIRLSALSHVMSKVTCIPCRCGGRLASSTEFPAISRCSDVVQRIILCVDNVPIETSTPTSEGTVIFDFGSKVIDKGRVSLQLETIHPIEDLKLIVITNHPHTLKGGEAPPRTPS
jgi:hypothetical protein